MISLDTNIFIYWLEKNTEFYEISAQIIKKIYSGEISATCSSLVLAEIYNNNPLLVEAIKNLPNLKIVNVSDEVTELAGKLRFGYGLKVIDSVHIASAIISGSDSFITNDVYLSKKNISKISIILPTKFL
ncbi:MAG: PIN domain-containing protein [bacterium]